MKWKLRYKLSTALLVFFFFSLGFALCLPCEPKVKFGPLAPKKGQTNQKNIELSISVKNEGFFPIWIVKRDIFLASRCSRANQFRFPNEDKESSTCFTGISTNWGKLDRGETAEITVFGHRGYTYLNVEVEFMDWRGFVGFVASKKLAFR